MDDTFPSAQHRHRVLRTPLVEPFPKNSRAAVFGMGCFWGAEQMFWTRDGVWTTMVGYAGGRTNAPTYREVCGGRTEHAEVVRIVYDEARVSYRDLLRIFWEGHDPTQYMRQGADVGTQYRSVIFYTDEAQKAAAEETRAAYAQRLSASGFGDIVTQIESAPPFHYAENYHQQYLAANAGGYCGHGGTGVRFD